MGCLAKVAISGLAWTSPSSGTVGRDSIPPPNATITGGGPAWIDVGIISDAQEGVQSTEIEIFRPSPGVLQLADVKETKHKRELDLTLDECSNFAWLLLRKCLKSNSPMSGNMGQHVPLSGGVSKLWLKIQDYDGENNDLLLIEQMWGHAKIDGPVARGGDQPVQFKLKVRQLWSPLNSSTEHSS